MKHYDIVIVGAGIAGASLGWALRPNAQVLLLEAESQPGYHTTGRSAAFYAETYGGPLVQPLTTASRAFFESPSAGFATVPLLTPRGGLHIADADALPALDRLEADFATSAVEMSRVDPGDICALLRSEWRAGGIAEPGCRDIDVAALHQGYLRGAEVMTDAPLAAARRDSGRWRLETPRGEVSCDILVNAAGAWGDAVAAVAGAKPVGLTPFRRTVVVLDVDPAPDASLPLVIAADGSFYFKPDAGKLWVSPHDETPDLPGDTQPDELDVAIAIDRLERATTWRVKRVERRWAGLRTFAPDRVPVIGFDAAVPGLFWFVGQGGFGIQTAPAAADLGAALITGRTPALDPQPYDPSRFAVVATAAAG
jgi:D-arginine dehydrogenase